MLPDEQSPEWTDSFQRAHADGVRMLDAGLWSSFKILKEHYLKEIGASTDG